MAMLRREISEQPAGFPQYFRGRLALRFHIPEGKSPVSDGNFFSEEPGRFPPDSEERRDWADGKPGIGGDPRATRLALFFSDWPWGTDFKVRLSGSGMEPHALPVWVWSPVD